MCETEKCAWRARRICDHGDERTNEWPNWDAGEQRGQRNCTRESLRRTHGIFAGEIVGALHDDREKQRY
jgi:hypothetical protein